jgi:hypothetical protein
MTPERWQRIVRICEQALERNGAEREEFLRDLSEADAELRAEVQSLLRFDRTSRGVLETGRTVAGASETDRSVGLSARSTGGGATSTSPRIMTLFRAVREHWWRLVLGVISVIPFAAAVVAVHVIWRHGGQAPSPGWTVDVGRVVITEIDAGGPAGGKLRPGDRIVAIDGDRRVAVLGTYWKLGQLRPGQSYDIEFEREGSVHRVALEYRVVPTGDRWTSLCRTLVGLIWAILGLVIGFVRPRMRTAQLVALAALSVGTMVIRASMYSLVPFMTPAAAGFYGVLLLGTAPAIALMYHAVYRFPPGAASGRFWSAALAIVYLAAGLHFLYSLLIGARYFGGPDVAMALEGALNSSQAFSPALSSALTGFTIVLTIAVAARNFTTAAHGDDRRRIKWILLAIGVSSAAELVHALFQVGPTGVIGPLADLMTITVPLAFAHGILRHRVFDIAVVIRIGLQYLLARNAVRLLVAGPKP